MNFSKSQPFHRGSDGNSVLVVKTILAFIFNVTILTSSLVTFDKFLACSLARSAVLGRVVLLDSTFAVRVVTLLCGRASDIAIESASAFRTVGFSDFHVLCLIAVGADVSRHGVGSVDGLVYSLWIPKRGGLLEAKKSWVSRSIKFGWTKDVDGNSFFLVGVL